MKPLQPGDTVFIYGGWHAIVACIAIRQKRGMCARLMFCDNSGPWVEVSKIKPVGGLLHASTLGRLTTSTRVSSNWFRRDTGGGDDGTRLHTRQPTKERQCDQTLALVGKDER